MFIGHFALGFAAKKVAPTVSLGTLFIAAQLADLVWPVLVLLDIEKVEVSPGITAFTPLDFIHYPYSHSLVGLLGWAIAFAAAYAVARREPIHAALIIAALVLSHWLLDFLTHRPDMPLSLGESQRVGLGLWNSVPATVVVEGLLFVAGVALYMRTTQAIDSVGRWALWSLVAFLVVIYIANIFGPPPPSGAAVAWTALAMWLLVAWGYWIDAHRRTSRVD
jgi:membrane-bound metal-dependent hydrolase YbcI (DUF457 family)